MKYEDTYKYRLRSVSSVASVHKFCPCWIQEGWAKLVNWYERSCRFVSAIRNVFETHFSDRTIVRPHSAGWLAQPITIRALIGSDRLLPELRGIAIGPVSAARTTASTTRGRDRATHGGLDVVDRIGGRFTEVDGVLSGVESPVLDAVATSQHRAKSARKRKRRIGRR